MITQSYIPNEFISDNELEEARKLVNYIISRLSIIIRKEKIKGAWIGVNNDSITLLFQFNEDFNKELEGSIKPPVIYTSTFIKKADFKVIFGWREQEIIVELYRYVKFDDVKQDIDNIVDTFINAVINAEKGIKERNTREYEVLSALREYKNIAELPLVTYEQMKKFVENSVLIWKNKRK